MQVVLPRAPLVEDLRLAERLLPARSPEPLLEHVLIRAAGRDCTLMAYDREVALWLRLTAEVERPGAAVVHGRRLLALLRQTDAESLRVEAVGPAVRLRAPGFLCELFGGDPADFPEPGPFPPRAHALLPAALLHRALRRTLFAAAPGAGHSQRYLLEAVLCEVGPDRLGLAASDNRRLAVAEAPLLPPRRPDRRRLLLSVKALGLLGRLAHDHEGPVRAFFGPPQAFFRVGRATLAARLLRGTFPDWRPALPAAGLQAVDLPIAALLAGVRPAAVLRDPTRARLLLRLEPGRLVIESRAEAVGRVAVEQAAAYNGEPRTLAFHPAYLLELLAALEGDEAVRLELGAPGKAVLFVAPDGYRHLLMPQPPAATAPEPVFPARRSRPILAGCPPMR
jgi:DNA polymerase-3 subunit beta